jgi:hypothetical protein
VTSADATLKRDLSVIAEDPAIHQGMDPRVHLLRKELDCRVKPGNDAVFVTQYYWRSVSRRGGESLAGSGGLRFADPPYKRGHDNTIVITLR